MWLSCTCLRWAEVQETTVLLCSFVSSGVQVVSPALDTNSNTNSDRLAASKHMLAAVTFINILQL